MPRIRTLLFTACASLSLFQASPSFAQIGGGHGASGGQDQSDDDAKKKKRDEAFGNLTAPLPKLKNAGPCPYVKVLYDAARYIDFKDNVEGSAAVRYSGEIQNVSSLCSYKAEEPITVKARVLFEFGRGPQAQSRTTSYRYWVAVTDRNHAVLDKATFAIPVTFPAGFDRVALTQDIDRIVIPRKNTDVSGANFEVLIGFEVTPQMAAFNRDGKRFKPNAGQVASASAPPP
jgi:hypothetical protein